MKRVVVLALILALAGATAVRAGVPGDTTPELDDAPDTLAVADVRVLIKEAVRREISIDLDRPYARDCERRSRLRMRCRMRFTTNFGAPYRATVEITRTGTFGSPTDRFRVTNAGRARVGAPRRAFSGTFVTLLRRAYFGDPLELPSGMDRTAARIRVGSAVDPLASEAPEGRRYVGFPVELRTTGPQRLDGSLLSDARLVLAGGRIVDPATAGDAPCEQEARFDIAPGETRLACVAFAVPLGARVRTLEIALDAGNAEEAGRWSARP